MYVSCIVGMQRFQRMVTIPEDEYNALRTMQQVGDPLEKHFQTLSSDYAKQAAVKDSHDRVLRQGEILNEMIKTKDMLRRRVHDATPKPYQHRVGSLFDHMMEKMQLSEKGEIYTKAGDVIEGSNIGDLVQHAVRDRRRKYTPVGWNMFLTHLKDANAPKMAMNYETLEELKPPSPASRMSSSHRSRSIAKRKNVNAGKRKMIKEEPYSSRHRRIKQTPSTLNDFVRY